MGSSGKTVGRNLLTEPVHYGRGPDRGDEHTGSDEDTR
jgi:hypothetical protein